ncbi:MAG: hypothetical protein U5O39_13265 [Gammaproteobacteria bacterium]|nr:hypothetical protein [Gammaproteobacteria bacterium]
MQAERRRANRPGGVAHWRSCIAAIDQANVERRDGRIVIEASDLRRSTSTRCEVKLGGMGRASFISLVAEHISITMGGNSRLSVENMTSDSVNVVTDGFSRLDIQARE